MTDITFVLDSSKINGALSHDFTLPFYAPIDLHEIQHEAALVSLNLWNTWFNVTAANGNNLFRYYNGTVWKVLTIPDGNYSLQTLEMAIHEGMKANTDVTIDGVTGVETHNINISSQIGTLKIKIEVKNSFKVDLATDNIRNLLGYDAIEVSVTQVGSSNANITNGLNELHLHCSLVNGGMYMNASTSDIIYNFVPAGPAGAALNFRTDNPLYMAIRDNRYIDSIRLYMTDQLGRSVSLNGEPLTPTSSHPSPCNGSWRF